MTHPLTAAKVDKPATIPQRSAAASRNEMHTDIAASTPSPTLVDFAESEPPSLMHKATVNCQWCDADFERCAISGEAARLKCAKGAGEAGWAMVEDTDGCRYPACPSCTNRVVINQNAVRTRRIAKDGGAANV